MLAPTQKSILAIGLFAAFADGAKSDEEREQIRRIAESLADGADQADLAKLVQDVLLKRMNLQSACAALDDAGERQLAYEMAVCVCDADGRQTDAERSFLADLRSQLALDPSQTQAFDAQADALVGVDLPGEPASRPVPSTLPVLVATAAAMPAATIAPAASDAELDRSILNHALVNGALELLPQSWASMAIIPLQVKMVYGIGKAHGVTLDQGHVKEFIAAAGVGLTSQYLEQAGRKLLGGLLGRVGGGLLRGAGNQAVSSGMSFASTYALGHVAKRYYAGGRTLSTQMLKDAYESVSVEAKGLQTKYLPAIQEKARTLDAKQVLNMVRGA